MEKGYWIILFREVRDPAKVAAYRDLASPVIQAAGAKFVVRGMPAQIHEAGRMERVVIIEFESLEQAIAVHDSPEYQAAVNALGDGAERDLRIVASA